MQSHGKNKKYYLKLRSCRFLEKLTTLHGDPHGEMGFCLNAAAEATQFSLDHQISGARQEVGQSVGTEFRGLLGLLPGTG